MRTWYSGAKTGGLENHESVLEAASAHTLCTDQNQRLSLEWWHFRHFLIDLQLVSVKLCLNDRFTLSGRKKHTMKISRELCMKSLLTCILGCQVHHLLLFLSGYSATKNPYKTHLNLYMLELFYYYSICPEGGRRGPPLLSRHLP